MFRPIETIKEYSVYPMFKKSLTIAFLIFASMITINAILVGHPGIIFIPPDWGILMKLGASLVVILVSLIVVKFNMKKN